MRLRRPSGSAGRANSGHVETFRLNVARSTRAIAYKAAAAAVLILKEALASMNIQITSTGMYAPPRIETAEDLSSKVGKSAEWIVSRTGVSRRHVSDEPVERMAAAAARRALGSSLPPDLLIYAATTARQLIPDTSVFVARELGLEGISCFTVHATCLSFLVGLNTAAAFIAARAYRKILIVSAEMGSVARDFAEPESAVLLGDGAGAAVVQPTPTGEGSKLLGYVAAAFPHAASFAEFRGSGVRRHPNNADTRPDDNLFHMNGTRLFRLGVRHVGPVLDRLFEQTGLGPSDIDLVVPHQPSKPGIQALARWGFRPERVVDIVGEYGNCIAASMPMALATADADGRLRRGSRVLLIGTGAGVSIVAAILEW
jgi:3-oxoacyl-[acyl-carrier-protein] synthase-3